MGLEYSGSERRQFVRLEYIAPLAYKVCKPEIIEQLLKGYVADVSPAGLSCNIKIEPRPGDILWLSFDRATLIFCEEMEKRSIIYQNGVIGKVVRVAHRGDDTYEVGVNFITREEKDSRNIYPKIHFLTDHGQTVSGHDK